MENLYQPLQSKVLDVITETPTIKTLVLKPPQEIPFKAGQFMQLTIAGIGEAPFTPSSSQYDLNTMEITILKAGHLTEAVHELKPGDWVGLRGPFGKGYPMEKFEGKEILVVGGGVGLAPLRALLYALFHNIEKYKRISIKYGARNPSELSFRNQYHKWAKLPNVDFECTVDRANGNWDGKVGLVTELLENTGIDLTNSFAVSCGPEIMLKFVTLKLLNVGFQPGQIYLSMNRKMSCGMGICGRCNIGPYYLCKDGPDMNYAKIQQYPDVFG
ncbi:MAG: FAD/NAD(P)-binding protein [Calditrichaeota bacterium]|nr:FAD/NAD(P)-binding protein [Calditrichota bacterium]RQV92183.1 MAG: oxidoreductase [bacterium]